MPSLIRPCGGGCGTWHYVGALGEPAFTNGWANSGGTKVPARFRTTACGFDVELGVTGGTPNSAIFTLPASIIALIDYDLPGEGHTDAGVFAPWHITTTGAVTDGA